MPNYSVTVATAATAEPLTLPEAKLHLRIDTSDNDDLLWSWIRTARELAERYTSRRLMSQTLRLAVDRWPRDHFILPGSPVTSIASVQYLDVNGDLQTWTASNYETDVWSEPARLARAYGISWPVVRASLNAIRINYVAGYSSAATVPEGIKTAMKITISALNEDREGIQELPQAAKNLLDAYRIGDEFLDYSLGFDRSDSHPYSPFAPQVN